MAFRPRIPVGPCLECGSQPEPKFRGFFSVLTRMECKCGVAGAWRGYTGGDPFHDAIGGWHGAKIERGEPPRPARV